MTLDTLPLNVPARISAVDWAIVSPDEAKRLQALGIDAGAEVSIAHRGVLWWRDPIAVAIGRMTVALRRAHAAAMTVEELPNRT